MTKIAPVRKRTKTALKRRLTLFLIPFLFAACTGPEERDLKKGMSDVGRGYFRISLSSFDRALKRDPAAPAALAAAREGARVAIFELKDYKKAVDYLRHLILHSQDPAEREQAQKQLASLYFENLQDYPRAIAEYSHLLATNPPFAEKAKYQISIARSYFYLGQFTQAESEVDDLLKERLSAQVKFDAWSLKGTILVARKQFAKAAEIYKSVMSEFPDRSREENIALQLAVCYEESQDFKAAVAVLEGLRESYRPAEYIELRIKRLQERIRNQPGAKGFRK